MKSQARWLRAAEPLFYILPSLIVLVAVFLAPTIDLVRISLYDAHTIAGVRRFVGFSNYLALLNPEFVAVIKRTLIYLSTSVPLTVVLGLGVALLLNTRMPAQRWMWLIAYIPWAIPHAIAAILWRWMIHTEYGLLNHLLVTVGLLDKPINFLGVDTAMASSVALRIWQAAPFAIITILAGLQSIPTELYEAAYVDGANGLQRFLHVTLPGLRGVLMTCTLMLAVWAFVTFDLIWVLTEGGPLRATETLPVAIYRLAFQRYNAGMASAMGVVSVLIIAAISFAYYKLTEERD